MFENRPKQQGISLPDGLGGVVKVSIPLSAQCYKLVEHYAQFSRKIPAANETQREEIRQQVKELWLRHEKARELDPKASCGLDLNNFWVIHESIPQWLREERSPRQKWNIPQGEGYSEKYLEKPLRDFAADIQAAFTEKGIDPTKLSKQIQIAATTLNYKGNAWTQLRDVYIHLRGMGYADRELVQ